jgi:hypothetical protein
MKFLSGIVALLLSVLSTAAFAATPPFTASEEVRNIEGGRTVHVQVAQAELKADINKSNMTQAAGGGALFALIDASVESSRAEKAEAAIGPLRDALSGFDVDALALATAKNSISETSWLNPATIEFSKDTSIAGRSALLDASPTEQIAFFEYTYDASPDFSSIRVVLTIQFANRTPPASKRKEPKPEDRLKPKNLAYTQKVTSVVMLPSPAEDDLDANVARWSADDGALARQALTNAFAQIERLTPRTLELGDDDIKAMNDRKQHKKIVAGGFRGREQEYEPGTLLVDGSSFVHVATLPEAEAPEEASADAGGNEGDQPSEDQSPAEEPKAEAP